MRLEFVRQFMDKYGRRPKCPCCHKPISHGDDILITWKGKCHKRCVEYTSRK